MVGDIAIGLHRAGQLAVGRQRYRRVEHEAARGDIPESDVACLDLERQRRVRAAEADGRLRRRGTGHLGPEGGQPRQVEGEIERAGLLATAARDRERTAVAAELNIADSPAAIGGQRGIAGQIDRGNEAGRYVGGAQAVDPPLPACREIALVDPGRELDRHLPRKRATRHRRQRLEARQIDGRAHFTLVVGGAIVAIALELEERRADLEGLHDDPAASKARHRGIDRNRPGLGQARIERHELQILDVALDADRAGELAIGL